MRDTPAQTLADKFRAADVVGAQSNTRTIPPAHCDLCKCGMKGLAFVDGRTKMGPWATMCLRCWDDYGIPRFGTGYGQLYDFRGVKQA